MPIVLVYGVDQEDADHNTLIDDIRQAVAGVKELGLTINEVSVYIVRDACPWGCPDVVVMVEGLFDKPERTATVRQKLATSLGAAVVAWAQSEIAREESGFSHTTQKVEVLVRRFNQESNGFFTQQLYTPPND